MLTSIEPLLKELFNPQFVSLKTGKFCFKETKDQGKGTCTFSSQNPVLYIKADDNKSPLIWSLNNRSSAEGAFLTFHADGNCLHIIEMKSTLKPDVWAKAKKQFEGMYISALAITKLLQLPDPIKIKAYIVYNKDQMKKPDFRNYVTNKPSIGAKNPFDGHDWIENEIQLNKNQKAQLIKVLRDCNGNAEIGHISSDFT